MPSNTPEGTSAPAGPTAPVQPAQSPSLVQWIVKNREQVSYLLFGLGAIFLILTIFLGLKSEVEVKADEKKEITDLLKGKDKSGKEEKPAETEKHPDYIWMAVWAGLMGATFLGLGFWTYQRTAHGGVDARFAKILILTGGGTAGILTALLGLKLGFHWQDHLLAWLNAGKSTQAKWVFYALLIFVGGLVIAFFSVQPARDEVRGSVFIRRIVFGYVTALTGLLTMVVLLGVNVVVAFTMPQSLDVTESGLHSLDDKSKNVLKDIHEPVHAYYIGNQNVGDMRSLFTNISRVAPNFVGTILDPRINREEIAKLYTKLPLSAADIGERGWGLILTVGDNEQNVGYIPQHELIKEKPPKPGEQPQGEPETLFDGEARIMTELQFLAEGKVKPILYFTQGEGELQIQPAPQFQPQARVSPADTATNLRTALASRNYEVRPLMLSQDTNKQWLKDATALVILGPKRQFSADDVKQIKEYLTPTESKKGGKMLVMLPPFADQTQQKIAPTGLESILVDFGITVPAERVVSIPWLAEGMRRPSVDPIIVGDPAFLRTDNPLVDVVDNFAVSGKVRPLPAGTGAGFQRQDLLVTADRPATWIETSMQVQSATVEALSDRRDNPLKKEKRYGNQMIPVGALVSEPGQPPRPRVAVLGISDFISEEGLAMSGNRQGSVQLVVGLLDWLRERPSGIGIAPRAQQRFHLSPNADGSRLIWMPLGLTLIVIVGAGIGIWLIRRS
jgi:hypothetical protein